MGNYPITDCVKDNTTGLTWEGKPTSGFRATDYNYSNYDSTTALQKGGGTTMVAPTQSEIDASNNSIGYKNAVNASALCGYTDWRLPTITELEGLVLAGVGSPTIDTTWFPNTKSLAYWSRSPYTGHAGYAGDAWLVHFNFGTTYNLGRYGKFNVRLVR